MYKIRKGILCFIILGTLVSCSTKRNTAITRSYHNTTSRYNILFNVKESYKSAMDKGLWKGTAAIHDRIEYWTEGVLAYFDATGAGVPPNDADHPVNTREALQRYDPQLFALVQETMAYRGKVDWRRW